MIRADARFGALAARLSAAAARIGRSHAEAAWLARRGDPARWRKAALLWPLFARD